jgi:hypothetical protein
VKNKRVLITACVLGVAAVSSVWHFSLSKYSQNRNLTDEALLALIKNDQKAFEDFIKAGGNLHDELPKIDGAVYTVAQGLSYFERTDFAKFVHSQKMSYVQQDDAKPFDIMTLSIAKNNPELLKQLALENPKFTMAYGKKGWTLLHMASASCSHKLTAILHQQGKLSWDLKAKDGSTPLTLAAEHDCLPMLSYWKDQKADFKAKDGRGLTALNILKKKKDAALTAFAESFEPRKIASIVTTRVVTEAAEPSFYKKRPIPKDQIVDHSAMLEPDDRPLEASETADNSEFAD